MQMEQAKYARRCDCCKTKILAKEYHFRIYGYRSYTNICEWCMYDKFKEVIMKNHPEVKNVHMEYYKKDELDPHVLWEKERRGE